MDGMDYKACINSNKASLELKRIHALSLPVRLKCLLTPQYDRKSMLQTGANSNPVFMGLLKSLSTSISLPAREIGTV